MDRNIVQELCEAATELAAWYGPFNPTRHPPEINGAWLRLCDALDRAKAGFNEGNNGKAV